MHESSSEILLRSHSTVQGLGFRVEGVLIRDLSDPAGIICGLLGVVIMGHMRAILVHAHVGTGVFGYQHEA